MNAYLRGSISMSTIALGLGMLGLGCGGGGNNGGPGGSTGAAGSGSYPNDPDFSVFESKRLKVSGNKLVDPAGATVRLLGINRAGTEYMCVQQGKIFDGSSGNSTITAMLTWNINTVRLPLNESCW